jgi:hypothetical protein
VQVQRDGSSNAARAAGDQRNAFAHSAPPQFCLGENGIVGQQELRPQVTHSKYGGFP